MIGIAITELMPTNRSGVARTPEQNERARAYAREFLKRHNDNKTEAALALGVAQPTFSNFVNGKIGAGNVMGPALAKALGISVSMLFDGVEEAAPHHSENSRPVLGSIRGADVALVKAKKREPFFPAFAWEDSFATAALITPPYVDEDMLIHAARLAISLRSATERDEAEGKRVDDEEAAREARQVEADRRVREAAARGEKLVPAKVMTQIRHEQAAQELEAARARDAAKVAANDAPPPPANDGAKKKRAKK